MNFKINKPKDPKFYNLNINKFKIQINIFFNTIPTQIRNKIKYF